VFVRLSCDSSCILGGGKRCARCFEFQLVELVLLLGLSQGISQLPNFSLMCHTSLLALGLQLRKRVVMRLREQL
jgi:hypothetical protein